MSSYYHFWHSCSLSETLSIIFWSKTCNQQIMVTPLKWLRATILIIYMQFPIKLILIKFFMIHIFKYLSLTKTILYFVGWGMVVDFLRHFQQYFSYIVTVSFIGGRKWWKQRTCRNLLTNLSHNVVSGTPRHGRFSKLQLQWCLE